MSKFTFIDLFAGIGGFHLGLSRVGGTCVFASEFDKFASKSYSTLYGEDILHGDITKIDEKTVPDHDVMAFGFPCQAFSVAGKRGGFEDTRGTLYFEAMRIANEKKPKIIVAENVKGIIGHDGGKTLDTIVKVANDCGYRVDFSVLNSKYFGVPQNRERWIMVGIREDLVENEPWIIEGTTVVPKGKRRISEYDDVKTFNFDFPGHGEVTTRLRDILEPVVDEKYYLSEDKTEKLVAQLEGNVEERTLLDTKPKDAFRLYSQESPTLQANDYKEPKQVIEPQMVGRVEGINGHDQKKRVYSVSGISPSPSGLGIGGNTEPKIAEPQMLGHIDIKGHDAIKRVYSAESVGPTLTTMGGGHREPKYRIRKLTPLECFRLQGFPDEAHQALVDAGISDSQRYKQAGNAVTVNVIEAIGERLIPLLNGI